MKEILAIISLFFISTGVGYAQKVSETKIKESEALYLMAEEYLAEKDFETAKSYYEKAIEVNPQHFESHWRLATYYFIVKNDYNSSIKYSNKGIGIYKLSERNLPDNNYNDLIKIRGLSFSFLEQYQESLSDLNEAIERSETSYYLYMQRAKVQLGLSKLDNALSDIKIAYKLNSTEPDVLLIYGVILYHVSEYTTAIDFLAKSVRDEAPYPDAYYFLGMAYYNINEESKAIYYLEAFLNHPSKELQVSGQVEESKSLLAVLYVNNKKWDKTIQVMLNYIERDSTCQLCYYSLIIAYAAKEDFQSAERLNAYCLTNFPGEGIFQVTSGALLFDKNEIEQAQNHFEQAYELGTSITDTLEFYGSLAENAIQVGDSALALRCVDRMISYYPDNELFYLNRIGFYMHNKKKYANEIIDDLEVLANLNYGNKEKKAYYIATKATMFISLGNSDDAYNEINKSVELDSFSEYYALRAFILFSKELQVAQELNDLAPLNKISDQVFQDIDEALQSIHRKKDAYLLKTTILIVLERQKEACETANEAINLGASINKDQLNYICKGKKPKERNNEWDFFYQLSSFEERFSE